jgi:glucosamine--fructose-6-phosphate aminotransferase (isomerizing)
MLSGFQLNSEELRKLDRINLVACGTAFFAAKLGVRYIRRLSNVPVEAYLSSEFPVESVGGKNTLTIAVTQSGETKDTLDALTRAKVAGGHVSSICNVIDSTIARFAGNGAYLYAGPEYSVASTKAFTNMSAVLMLLALTLSETDNTERARVIRGLREMPQRMSSYLHSEIDFESIVDLLVDSKTALFIGRGPNSHIASEAALKMMEITYLPCIAYPGGELKHGPIALIEEGTPVIAIAPDDSHYPKMEANIRECASRGANVILLTNKETSVEDYCAKVIRTPFTDPFLSPFMSIMPLHLLAYHLAVRLERNVDRPRNLAKSVTVV